MAKRIAIIGNPGSGKSTLAVRLGKLLNIPVHHLDTYAFVNGSKTNKQELIQIQQKLLEQDSWIIEGCSISTLEMRFEKADMAVFLNIPRTTCIRRALKRLFIFDEHLTNSGCIRIINWTLFKYIWNFEKNEKPEIYNAKNKFPDLHFLVLQSAKEIEDFLNSFLI